MRKNVGALYAFPIGLWITLFFVVPISVIVLYSFMAKGLYGGVVFRFSLRHYPWVCALPL